MNLGNHQHANHQRATVHLDIFTPFQDLRPLSAHELGSEMQVARFAAYPHLDCLADANRLLIVTLRAPRQIVLNRWLDRVAREHRENGADKPRKNLLGCVRRPLVQPPV